MRERGFFEVPGWGRFNAVWEADKLLILHFSADGIPPVVKADIPPADPFLAEVAGQVAAYLQGRLRRLDLPHVLPREPAFRYRLWREAQAIPYGEVVSYGGLAARAGNPRAARAAGSAMCANPLFLLVPCHRVIAAGGQLGGYGGRPDLKIRLLTLEGLTVTAANKVSAAGGGGLAHCL